MQPRRRHHHHLFLLAALAGAAGAAHGAGTDITPFLGTWIFRGGSQIATTCPPPVGALPPQAAGGTRISIYPGTTTDLVFDMGCHCRLNLNLSGSNQAALAGPQDTCTLIVKQDRVDGDFTSLTLDRNADQSLNVTLGGNATLILTNLSCGPGPFSGTGTIDRTGSATVTCGDPVTAVGVIPYAPSGPTDCPFGAGLEGFDITMHDEDTPSCSGQTGASGEGSWVLPDDTRERQRTCPTGDYRTRLYFCRVDGALFKPMTADPDPNQYYAVLRLGDRCPTGSIEVSKTIDNEDSPLPNADGTFTFNGVVGNPGPNSSRPSPGTNTTLYFCYFRQGAPGATMASFPDLGLRYAVFHRYDGEQPPWVMAKVWRYSNDEDGQANPIRYDSPDLAARDEFKAYVIEDPPTATYFNMARVR
jgi:hypothetical protein